MVVSPKVAGFLPNLGIKPCNCKASNRRRPRELRSFGPLDASHSPGRVTTDAKSLGFAGLGADQERGQHRMIHRFMTLMVAASFVTTPFASAQDKDQRAAQKAHQRRMRDC